MKGAKQVTTPTQRLEERKRLSECRVCAWLATLSEDDRKEWGKAIGDRRFGAEMIATEIKAEVDARLFADPEAYSGQTIGESSVDTHRARGHR